MIYDTEEVIQANRLKKKKKKPKHKRGIGSTPNWNIIIIRSNFKRDQQENLTDSARFIKEYAPLYGTNTSAQKMMTTSIIKGFFRQYNYGLPVKELEEL